MDSIGALTASIGALLLAVNGHHARWGWWLFLVSNIAWSVYAVQEGVYTLLVQEVVYLAINIIGLWQWWGKPAIAQYRKNREYVYARAERPY